MDRHLFLFGGSPPFTSNMAKKFVKKTTMKSPISILCVEREGWEEYMPRYTSELKGLGITDFIYLPLPTTSTKNVIDAVKMSSGIIIGGGDTNLYADYIVETPISNAIRESYQLGIPVAGFSAGALISPEECIISSKDNRLNKFQQRKGLGLISKVVIAVHFSQRIEENHLREAVSKFPEHLNYGIDENTGVYFLNEQFEETEGNGVYCIEDKVIKKIK